MGIETTGAARVLTLKELQLNPTPKADLPVTTPSDKPVSKLTPQDSTAILHKSTPAHAKANVPFVGEHSAVTKTGSIDSPAVFRNSNVASAAAIDKILTGYHSPLAGKGQAIMDACKKHNINPMLMLAVMQQESGFGSSRLKEENQANPFSVHFNEHGKGIQKLRHKDGSLPSFEQSLEGGINTLLRHAGSGPNPLTTAGKKYSETGSWSAEVTSKYNHLMGKL
ncbi:MAG: glucosaminidase domain-containing protein [Candidatus Sericytochromatia bacterium]|nr:glucosaminidase domain-containing protein [Candidatus Sericytochromatia bacterium]